MSKPIANPITDTFHCPVCGSAYFCTEGGHPNGIGRCKGHYDPFVTRSGHTFARYTGCSFEWPRTDDAKYFRTEQEKGKATP